MDQNSHLCGNVKLKPSLIYDGSAATDQKNKKYVQYSHKVHT